VYDTVHRGLWSLIGFFRRVAAQPGATACRCSWGLGFPLASTSFSFASLASGGVSRIARMKAYPASLCKEAKLDKNIEKKLVVALCTLTFLRHHGARVSQWYSLRGKPGAARAVSAQASIQPPAWNDQWPPSPAAQPLSTCFRALVEKDPRVLLGGECDGWAEAIRRLQAIFHIWRGTVPLGAFHRITV
jgi:hypothetical protein